MLKRFSFFMLLFALISMAVKGQGQEGEAALKAAFIYNFTKYIDWNNAIQDKFIIGILGTSQVYDELVEIAQKNTVNGKRIIVRKFLDADDISFCNILFIPSNTTFSLSSILARVDKGTLTISEQEGFAEMGTAFNFVIVHDKLKFEANLNSISAAGLKASSQLLKLAKIVD